MPIPRRAAVTIGLVLLLTMATVPVAPAASGNSTFTCGTSTTVITTTRALESTYTVRNNSTTVTCDITATGATGVISWTSDNPTDSPSTNPTTLRPGATLTVTMLAVGGPTTLQFTNQGTVTGTHTINFSVAIQTPFFTARTPPTTAAVGSAYPGYTFIASGGAITYALASGAIPPGLTLAPNGLLTGTPTTSGNYTFTVSATNTAGARSTPAITITVSGSGNVPSGSSSPVTETLELFLVPGEGADCAAASLSASRGVWVSLPKAPECAPSSTQPRSVLLGWATSAEFPVAIAQRQVDNGWGTYETFNADGQLTGVFIPAGGSTLVSAAAHLYAVWSE